LASIQLAESLVTMHLVPLVTRGGSKERKIIISAPTFNESKCGATLRLLKSLKNSVGNSTARVSSGTESKDLYWMQSPGNSSTKVLLMVRVVLFKGAKIQCSDNQSMFMRFER